MNRLITTLIATTFAAASGCGGDSGTGPGDVTMAQGDLHYYAVSKLKVPMDRSQFSIDLNGDGRPDNALGNIINTLSMQGNLDVQGAIDKSVAKGTVILLISVQATSLGTADNAGATVYLGKANGAPDFGGMGMFTVDASQNPGKFFGKLAGNTFKSNNPVTTKSPVSIAIKLPLVDGVDPLALNLNGAHLTLSTDGSKVTGGELHGSIKKADIDNSIIPAVATLLTKKIQSECSGSAPDGGTSSADGGAGGCSDAAKQLKTLFDTGGCGSAKANDNIIDACEVAQSSLVMNVLAPDVQIFDANGNYAPSATNKMKDSLSLGLGFDLVGAAKF